MKKLNLLLIVFIGLFILSCSSDENNIELSKEEILVKNSPWTFEHYEIIGLLTLPIEDFTMEGLESEVNQKISGNIFTFNLDGTGSRFFPGEETSFLQWEILNNSQLKITFKGSPTSTVFKELNISSSQLTFDAKSVHFGVFKGVHTGKYIYKN